MSPFSESARCVVIQEFLNILLTPKVYYHVYKSPPLIPILSQISAVHTTPSFLELILTLTTHHHHGLLVFPPKSYMHSSLPFVLHSLPREHLTYSNYTWHRYMLWSRKPRLTAMETHCVDHATPVYPQKLALTSPTRCGRSVGIVRL
jgi:hypothetical protein